MEKYFISSLCVIKKNSFSFYLFIIFFFFASTTTKWTCVRWENILSLCCPTWKVENLFMFITIFLIYGLFSQSFNSFSSTEKKIKLNVMRGREKKSFMHRKKKKHKFIDHSFFFPLILHKKVYFSVNNWIWVKKIVGLNILKGRGKKNWSNICVCLKVWENLIFD